MAESKFRPAAPSSIRSALFAIERKDGRGLCTWIDHMGDTPVEFVLLWTDDEKAERYAHEELKDTGRVFRIRKSRVLPFLRKMLVDTGIRHVWLDRPSLATAEVERGTSGIAEIPILIAYLLGGGRIAGERIA